MLLLLSRFHFFHWLQKLFCYFLKVFLPRGSVVEGGAVAAFTGFQVRCSNSRLGQSRLPSVCGWRNGTRLIWEGQEACLSINCPPQSLYGPTQIHIAITTSDRSTTRGASEKWSTNALSYPLKHHSARKRFFCWIFERIIIICLCIRLFYSVNRQETEYGVPSIMQLRRNLVCHLSFVDYNVTNDMNVDVHFTWHVS